MSTTTPTDRELLEMAAKAAGLGVESHNDNRTVWAYRLDDMPDENGEHETFVWRPLTDDGDGARLECSLSLQVTWAEGGVWVGRDNCNLAYARLSKHGGLPQDARRHAAVLAAAEIGRRLP